LSGFPDEEGLKAGGAEVDVEVVLLSGFPDDEGTEGNGILGKCTRPVVERLPR
jgi:hypothetical protein